MIISELIKNLEDVKKQHGDIPIFQHGHSVMTILDTPNIDIAIMNESMATKIIMTPGYDIEIGEKFAWL